MLSVPSLLDCWSVRDIARFRRVRMYAVSANEMQSRGTLLSAHHPMGVHRPRLARVRVAFLMVPAHRQRSIAVITSVALFYIYCVPATIRWPLSFCSSC